MSFSIVNEESEGWREERAIRGIFLDKNGHVAKETCNGSTLTKPHTLDTLLLGIAHNSRALRETETEKHPEAQRYTQREETDTHIERVISCVTRIWHIHSQMVFFFNVNIIGAELANWDHTHTQNFEKCETSYICKVLPVIYFSTPTVFLLPSLYPSNCWGWEIPHHVRIHMPTPSTRLALLLTQYVSNLLLLLHLATHPKLCVCVWPGQSCWASSDFLLSSWWRRKGSKAQAPGHICIQGPSIWPHPVWVCIITGLTLSLVCALLQRLDSSSKPRHPSCSWDRSYVLTPFLGWQP